MKIGDDLKRLEAHYAALFENHGDTPAAVHWSDQYTQEVRLRELCRIGGVAEACILDFGCGTGHLLNVLRREFNFSGAYVGYDLSEPHIAAARSKFPDALFERRDIFAEGIDREFDFAFVSGVFNNRISDNWEFIRSSIRILFAACRKGLAFNCLSTYVDYYDQGLFYANPLEVFDYCKRELSPFVVLRHDYRIKPNILPYEFTMYVYRDR